jgi:hypothetical protein
VLLGGEMGRYLSVPGGEIGTGERVMKQFMVCWKGVVSSGRGTVLDVRMSTGYC